MTTTSPEFTIQAAHVMSISQTLAQIYHLCTSESSSAFLANAATQLGKIVPFDSMAWLVFSQSKTCYCRYSYGQGLAEQKLAQYLEGPDDEQLKQQTLSSEAVKLYSLQQSEFGPALISSVLHGKSQHIICLGRNRELAEFSEQEQATLAFAAKTLANALQQHLQVKMQRHNNYRNSQKAIFDSQGMIVEAQKGFVETMITDLKQLKWPPDFAINMLPLKIKYDDSINIQLSEDGGLLIAEAYHFDENIEALTDKERTIAHLFVQGMTNKAIADKFDRSARTVENQVKSICNKLGVKTRQEAVWQLKNSDYLFE